MRRLIRSRRKTDYPDGTKAAAILLLRVSLSASPSPRRYKLCRHDVEKKLICYSNNASCVHEDLRLGYKAGEGKPSKENRFSIRLMGQDAAHPFLC